MARADRIKHALESLRTGDLENATMQVAVAIDATAKAKYPNIKRVGKRFRAFLLPEQEFILYCALGCGPRFIFSGDGGFRFGTKGSLEDVLYEFARSPLVHEGDASAHVSFMAGPVAGMDGDKFIISDAMLAGLILVVVGDPANARERLKPDRVIDFAGKRFPINACWGRLADIRSSLQFR